MTRRCLGIVDYGAGNHASVVRAVDALGWRCTVSDRIPVLEACDVLLLPGVGAFRPAIEALRTRGLDGFLIARAAADRPLLGICLGLQLLAEGSHEDGFTAGLGIFPGEVVRLPAPQWHIGWNTLRAAQADPLIEASLGCSFYFNHAYVYRGPERYHLCNTLAGGEFPSAIRRGRTIGVQFHPEKSQSSGRVLLGRLLQGLCDAP